MFQTCLKRIVRALDVFLIARSAISSVCGDLNWPFRICFSALGVGGFAFPNGSGLAPWSMRFFKDRVRVVSRNAVETMFFFEALFVQAKKRSNLW